MIIKSIKAETTWPIRHEVMWPNMPFDFVKLPDDENGKHFGLFVNQTLVSVVSLFETAPKEAQFRKFATIASEQGKGYGSELLHHLIKFAKHQGYQTLWCNARNDKTAFYARFAMCKTNDTFIKEGVRFVILKKVL